MDKWFSKKKYYLFSFQHRIIYRLSIFSFNCKNNKTIDIIETNLVRNNKFKFNLFLLFKIRSPLN